MEKSSQATNSYKGSEKIEEEAKRLELMAIIANEESRRVLQKIRESGFNPKVIADFGCGTGDAFRVFEDLFPSAAIIGFDQSEKATALAKSKYPEAKLFTTNMATKDTFSASLGQTEKIDLAYFRNTLLHLPDPLETIKTAKNHLSPGSILFAQEPDWDTAEANWKDFSIFKEAFTTMMQALKINPYMGKQLKTVFEKAGIQKINIDISTKKVFSNDSSWEILDQLIEVGGERLAPFLQERGIVDVQEMRKKIGSAKENPENYYRTPSWTIAWALL